MIRKTTNILLVSLFMIPILVKAQTPVNSSKIEAKPFNFNSFTNEKQKQDSEIGRILNLDFLNHPEYMKLPKDAPCENCFEVLSRREIDLRYYLDKSDTTIFFIQKGNQPLHVKQDGYLVSIDHQLKNKGNYFESSNFHNTISVYPQIPQVSMYCEQLKQSFNFNNWSLFKTLNGNTSLVAKANWKNFTAGDDGVFVKDIFPGIDAEMVVMRGMIKTNFVVRSIKPIGEFDELSFVDHLEDLSGEITLAFENNKGTSKQTGNVEIFSNNKLIGVYKEGITYSLNEPKERNAPIIYGIEKNNLEMSISGSWLKETLEYGDVVVDPIVTGSNTLAQASITGSMYNVSCGFDNSCNYNLTVPAPANATFDDVFWSFAYIAQGICWMNEGATRFATGTCLSPGQANFYYFCNQIGGGTCTGTNISIFNDVESCLPAPACTPQNVDFTLQFFRSCWGPIGCDNSCIGANSPWTVTIQGQTIAYSNITSPITVSSTTVCQGDAITATTSGQNGVPPYTYEWSFDPSGTPVVGTGASTSITFPNAGNVTLYSIVTDACGNEVVESVNITVDAAPMLTVTATDLQICVGESTTISASGGGATYNWDNGLGAGASHTVSPTTTTTYNVTSASTTGCQGVGSIEITVNPLPNVIAGTNQVVCQGDQVTLNGSGNANTYTWDNGVTNGVAFTPPPGVTTYTVTGDLNGCQNQDDLTVTVQPEINFTVAGTDPTDCNLNDGILTFSNLPPGQQLEITFNFNGTPVGPNTYTVDGGGNVVINNLAVGNYNNFEVDFNNCTSQLVTSVTLANPSGPTVTAPADQQICEGDEITLTANTSGGTITWSGGVSDGVPFTPPAGTNTYVVTVDLNGCTNTDEVTITVAPEMVLTMTTNPSACTIDDGSATVTVSGGVAPFSYSWSPSGASTATATGLGPGSYTVTVTDNNGCSASASVNVGTVNGPIVVIEDVINPSCFGSEDGSATANVSGGTPPYNYQWNPAGGNAATGTGLGNGVYTVTVVDAAGCTTLEDVTMTAPDEIVLNGDSTPSDCGEETGSIALNASGGAGGFTYDWSPNVNNSPNATNIPAGDYTIIVTDANGCSESITLTVGQLDDIDVFIIPDNAVIDFGQSVILTVETDPTSTIVNYTWSPADGLSCTDCANPTATPNQTTTYTVTIITDDGCTGQAQVTIEVIRECEETFIPTIFSPNNDGINDELCIIGDCVSEIELFIYNRWGERVYQTTDPTACWRGNHKGRPVNTGVYSFKARILLVDGTEIEESGNITLVR